MIYNKKRGLRTIWAISCKKWWFPTNNNDL